MPQDRLTPGSGTLWRSLVRREARALESGALRPIATELRFVEEAGVRFVVRVVSSLARKDADGALRAAQGGGPGGPVNPFLPFDPELFVADVSDSHVCLLNKFKVIDHHLLVVTRAFEDQESLLTVSDFEALGACMAGLTRPGGGGLGFYNGGRVAGASQLHKHLQVVPLPLAGEGPAVPLAPLLEPARSGGAVTTAAALPFRHALAWLDPSAARRPAAAALHARYCALLAAAGIEAVETGAGPRQSAPYNLLVTGEWMLLVPRSRECFDSISVNALGFAGAFFVRDANEMRTLEAHGPMTVLRAVAVPRR